MLPQKNTAFLMGLVLLLKYQEVLDYAKYSRTLAVGRKHFRVRLGEE